MRWKNSHQRQTPVPWHDTWKKGCCSQLVCFPVLDAEVPPAWEVIWITSYLRKLFHTVCETYYMNIVNWAELKNCCAYRSVCCARKSKTLSLKNDLNILVVNICCLLLVLSQEILPSQGMGAPHLLPPSCLNL